MPLSIYEKLNLGEIKPTSVTLQLADRSFTHPLGIVEDVLVKVDKFILPADFLVLDIEEDENIPLILGRPFLATGRSIIDVGKRELRMSVGEETVIFKVYRVDETPITANGCYLLDEVELVTTPTQNTVIKDDVGKPHDIKKNKFKGIPKRTSRKRNQINPFIQDFLQKEVKRWVQKLRN